GLISAAGAAGVGPGVALVERAFLGGDCLNVRCVPSKALIRASRAAAEVRDAHDYGVEDAHEKGVRTLLPERPEGCVEKGPDPFSRVNFAAVMERMRRLRAAL